jgi:hypothetical protein
MLMGYHLSNCFPKYTLKDIVRSLLNLYGIGPIGVHCNIRVLDDIATALL